MKFNAAPFNSLAFDATRYDAVAALAGVSATGAVGTLQFRVDSSNALAGVQATGALGTLALAITSTVTLSGVSGAGQVGTLAVALNAAVLLQGVAGAGAAGSLAVRVDAQTVLSSVSATGQVGTLAAAGGEAAITITGVGAAGAVGELGTDAGAVRLDGMRFGGMPVEYVADRTDRRSAAVRLRNVAGAGHAGALRAHADSAAPRSVDLAAAVRADPPPVAQVIPLLRLRARTDSLVVVRGVAAQVVPLVQYRAGPVEALADPELEEAALLLACGWE